MDKILLRVLLIIALISGFGKASAQENQFSDQLFNSYEKYREGTIDQRRFKHNDILPLISQLKSQPVFTVQKVGESIEGRSLNLISLGSGETDVFLWSQMHGDESTATMAIMDIFNFFSSEDFKTEKQLMLKNLRIHFLPMLNPDGAQVFQRRNALGVDVNRDAVRLQSPESKTLKRVRDSLDADFGFNLHDQSKYYNAERTSKPATISFLAPAFNYEKDTNKVRANAMKLIVSMNKVLQRYAPGQVGRYNDNFEPRAFGDNIQKWGTSTILIESGGYPDDPEKQEIRKLNFVAILSALYAIGNESYQKESISAYEEIPNNDHMLFDLKLRGLTYKVNGKNYILDVGIDQSEADIDENTGFYYSGRIADMGDLSTSHGYKNLNADGYTLEFGKIYPETFKDTSALNNLDFSAILSQGYAYMKVSELPESKNFTKYPLTLVPENYQVEEELKVGKRANFFLKKNGKVEFTVINGFLTSPENAQEEVKNGLILD